MVEYWVDMSAVSWAVLMVDLKAVMTVETLAGKTVVQTVALWGLHSADYLVAAMVVPRDVRKAAVKADWKAYVMAESTVSRMAEQLVD